MMRKVFIFSTVLFWMTLAGLWVAVQQHTGEDPVRTAESSSVGDSKALPLAGGAAADATPATAPREPEAPAAASITEADASIASTTPSPAATTVPARGAPLERITSVGPAAPVVTPPSPPKPQDGSALYTLAEVARHASQDDCWMIIAGEVYDFSAYLPKHPSNPRYVLPWCGKEASEAYRTKTTGRSHSSRADQLLPAYRIGRLAPGN